VSELDRWVDVPAGMVSLRDARTGSTRTVRLRSFRLGRASVTAEEFAAGRFGTGAGPPAAGVSWLEAVTWCNRASIHAGLEPAYLVGSDQVRWLVAADGFRLPTEAEWEHACRAGTATPTYGPLDEIAWTERDGRTGPAPVGGKRPNAYGLHDMLGNVWEWCWDYADPARYADYRVLKGGGWADPTWSCRVSVRRGSAPAAVLEDVGFRTARGAMPAGVPPAAQGWSDRADHDRANRPGPIPFGWTPLRP
jgi:formylglycine-generating enzyme required for sulfatase activity